MKKLFSILMLSTALFIVACTGCKKEVSSVDTPTIINVDSINIADNEVMTDQYGKYDLKWYECEILLNNFLNEENDGSIAELVNIFQVTEIVDSTSARVVVHKIQHFADGATVRDSVEGFWIENMPLCLEDIKIAYDSACILVEGVNLPKPHSRHITIRKPLGPKDCNIQYIFGNIQSQIWVDAITGEIKESNPAFEPDAKGYLGMPLGEWP